MNPDEKPVDNPPWTMFFEGPLYQKYDEFMRHHDFSKILQNKRLQLSKETDKEPEKHPDKRLDPWENPDYDKALPAVSKLKPPSLDSYEYEEDRRRRRRRTCCFICSAMLIIGLLSLATALVIHYVFIVPKDVEYKAQVNVSVEGNDVKPKLNNSFVDAEGLATFPPKVTHTTELPTKKTAKTTTMAPKDFILEAFDHVLGNISKKMEIKFLESIFKEVPKRLVNLETDEKVDSVTTYSSTSSKKKIQETEKMRKLSVPTMMQSTSTEPATIHSKLQTNGIETESLLPEIQSTETTEGRLSNTSSFSQIETLATDVQPASTEPVNTMSSVLSSTEMASQLSKIQSTNMAVDNIVSEELPVTIQAITTVSEIPSTMFLQSETEQTGTESGVQSIDHKTATLLPGTLFTQTKSATSTSGRQILITETMSSYSEKRTSGTETVSLLFEILPTSTEGLLSTETETSSSNTLLTGIQAETQQYGIQSSNAATTANSLETQTLSTGNVNSQTAILSTSTESAILQSETQTASTETAASGSEIQSSNSGTTSLLPKLQPTSSAMSFPRTQSAKRKPTTSLYEIQASNTETTSLFEMQSLSTDTAIPSSEFESTYNNFSAAETEMHTKSTETAPKIQVTESVSNWMVTEVSANQSPSAEIAITVPFTKSKLPPFTTMHSPTLNSLKTEQISQVTPTEPISFVEKPSTTTLESPPTTSASMTTTTTTMTTMTTMRATTTTTTATTTTDPPTTLPPLYNVVTMADVTAYTFEPTKIHCDIKVALKWSSVSIKGKRGFRPLELQLHPNGQISWKSKKSRHEAEYSIADGYGDVGNNITLDLIIDNLQCRDGDVYSCILFSEVVNRQAKNTLTAVGKPGKTIRLSLGPSIIEDRAVRLSVAWDGGYPIPWTNVTWTAVDRNNNSYDLSKYGEYKEFVLRVDDSFCQTRLNQDFVIFPKMHLNGTTIIVKPDLRKKKGFVDEEMSKDLMNVEPGIQSILVIPLNYCPKGREQAIPHPYENCKKFVWCLPGDLVVQQCPYGTCFYEKQGACLAV